MPALARGRVGPACSLPPVPRPGAIGDAAASVATVARNPGLRNLNIGWAGSISGEYLTLTPLAVYRFGAHGATGVGLVAVAQMGPALLAAPFAAALGDRFRRERVLAATELARAIASVLCALAVLGGAGALVVYVLAGFLGASRTAYYPAQAALVPLLARHPDEITASAATLNLTKNIANLAVPAFAGILLLLWPLGTVFIVAAAAFLGASALAAMRLPSTVGVRAPVPGSGGTSELFRGFAAARRDGALRVPLALGAAQGLGRGVINVLVIILPLQLLGLGDASAGFFTALIGLGGIAGVLLSFVLVGKRALAVPMAAGLVAMGLPYFLPAAAPAAWAAAAALVTVGIGNGLMGVAGMSLLTRESRDDVLSRVMGVQELLRAAGIVAGSIATPFLTDMLGFRWGLAVIAAVIAAGGIVAFPAARRLDRAAAGPPSEVALLGSSPLFGRLQPVALDRVARRMRRQSVRGGSAVVREGDEGDRVFLVVEGTFGVSAQGGPWACCERGMCSGRSRF